MWSSLVFRIAAGSRSIRKQGSGNKPAEGRAKYGRTGRTAGSNASIDGAVAEKTVGIILGFLRSEGPSENVEALIDQIPGAEAAMKLPAAAADCRG